MYLPHLQGERAPVGDAATRGVFARLDGGAGPAEMARAVLEGVAFSVRWAFEALQHSSGRSIATANIGGGGARSDVWCQIKADALGLALRRASTPDCAALGAAMLAGIGSGTMASLHEAIRLLIRFDRSFEPQPALRGYYDERFGKYRELYAALKSFNATF
jgi:xylulokinase